MRDGPRVAVLLLAIIAVAGVSSALGETLSVGLSKLAVITGDVGEHNVARVVINVEVPEQVLDSKIDFAKLQFPVFTPDSGDAAVTAVARDCKTAWGDGATWTVPWNRPGGDFDSLNRAWFAVLPGSEHPVVLDITRTIRGWQRGGGKYGLFLLRPDAEGGGFLGERDRIRTALNSARVKFYFTPTQQ
jgi:hypothetical protein